jgi:hypothetical protein
MKRVDTMEIYIIDSNSLREELKSYGISLRHMGEAAKKTT